MVTQQSGIQRSLARPTKGLLIAATLVVLAVWLVAAGRITETMLLSLAVLVPSIVLHEVSHGAVAAGLGDDTARRHGRLSLNPAAHVDVVGTLILPALTVLGGFGFVGWAKPVPVDTAKLRGGRNGAVAVSLAGPLMNVALMVVAIVGFKATYHPTVAYSPGVAVQVCYLLGLTNLWLACFNLLPIPPLDGATVLERLLPSRAWPRYLRIRPYFFPVVIGFVLLTTVFHVGIWSSLSSWLENRWDSILGIS
jgi:Zn-dependent protease